TQARTSHQGSGGGARHCRILEFKAGINVMNTDVHTVVQTCGDGRVVPDFTGVLAAGTSAGVGAAQAFGTLLEHRETAGVQSGGDDDKAHHQAQGSSFHCYCLPASRPSERASSIPAGSLAAERAFIYRRSCLIHVMV